MRTIEKEYGTITVGMAPLGGEVEPEVPYMAVTGHDDGLQPLFFEKGFNDSDIAADFASKMELGDVLAQYGYGLVVSGTERTTLLSGNGLSGGVIGGQAAQSLAVVRHLGLEDVTLPLVGYSTGAQVAARMVAQAAERDLKCFEASPVVLLAPMGVNRSETPLGFFRRGISKAIPKVIEQIRGNDGEIITADDVSAAAAEAGSYTEVLQAFLRHPYQGVRQYRETTTWPISLERLSSRVGSVAVAAFGEDWLIPEEVLRPDVAKGMQTADNITYFMPYDTNPDDPAQYGIADATHVDPFDSPGRVGKSIGSYFRSLER